MLDLSLTEEQDQLVDAVRGLLRRSSTPEVVRSAEADGIAVDLWDGLRELGLVEMALPLEAGGAGAGLLDAALVAELVGEHVAPVPFVEATVAGRLLARLCTPVASELLKRQAVDGIVVAVALRPAVGGRALAVPAGRLASHVVVLDRDRLLLVAGARMATMRHLGSVPVADWSVPADAEVLLDGAAAVALHRSAVAEWSALMAAQFAGATRRVVELGTTYTSERVAFGVPIASFQTISHRLADAAVDRDGLLLLARKAAWAHDQGRDDAGRLASMAFLFGGEVAERAATQVLHFHGGYGFMLEYDIQLYFQRIKAWSLLGDRAREAERLADLLWEPAEEAE